MNTRTNIQKILAALVFLVLATLTIGACNASAAASPDQGADEALLSKQIHNQLVTLPWYGVFDNLEYTINGSEVRLTGQVFEPITKSDAEARMKRLVRVTRVENNITVLPLSMVDNRIRRAELHAIFFDTSLSRYAMGAVPTIHIIVNNGHVTLEGVVSSEMDRTIANIRANTVPGVFSVTNNLRIG
jgi:hyperosmotically inducible periplasmic protein